MPLLRVACLAVLAFSVGLTATASAEEPCVSCLEVRVGLPIVARGPYPDELDASFTALRLADGSMRGFSANGTTYAVDGATLLDMEGQRTAVLPPGDAGSLSECGRWLTSTLRLNGNVLGLVHQERACDYGQGRTSKSMAIARSADDGLTWTELQTVITGTDTPQPDRITGEGDCTLVDGADDYLYAYCLRNSDWQTIVARAPVSDPTDWRKFYQGTWSEPGLGGKATAIGFVGHGTGYLKPQGLVAAIAVDKWFGGLRLSVSQDKVSFTDVKEPLVPMDDSDWNRPAPTALLAYPTMLDPETGSDTVNQRFLLAYIYVPPGKGFENRYLVLQDVSLTVAVAPLPVQVGIALGRWSDPDGQAFISSTGPLTGDRADFKQDSVIAYLLTSAPDGKESIKLEECSSARDQMLAADGGCAVEGYARERTAGWVFASEQPGTVPVYRCIAKAQAHFASRAADCEGMGTMDLLLGYGLPS